MRIELSVHLPPEATRALAASPPRHRRRMALWGFSCGLPPGGVAIEQWRPDRDTQQALALALAANLHVSLDATGGQLRCKMAGTAGHLSVPLDAERAEADLRHLIITAAAAKYLIAECAQDSRREAGRAGATCVPVHYTTATVRYRGPRWKVA